MMPVYFSAPPDLKKWFDRHHATAFFEAQPPGYQRVITWWVISAKKEATRLARLEQLIQKSAEGLRIR
jgi:uncharacterized protein YdeI (YjbR/CyaY-like superfamily)